MLNLDYYETVTNLECRSIKTLQKTNMASVISKLDEYIISGSKSLRGPKMAALIAYRNGVFLTNRGVINVVTKLGIMIVRFTSNNRATDNWEAIHVRSFCVSDT